MNGEMLVDERLRFRTLLRLLGGRRFDVSFVASAGAEIEIRVTGSGAVVLELQNE